MKRFDYDVRSCEASDVESTCNEAGGEGWELVSALLLPDRVMLVFKRENVGRDG